MEPPFKTQKIKNVGDQILIILEIHLKFIIFKSFHKFKMIKEKQIK